MRKQLTYLISIGILNLLLFASLFCLFQNDSFYKHTLGLFSENYERIGGWDNFEIKKTAKPFLPITNSNFETWDADIYRCISERMYKSEIEHYGQVRGAFFPLFPLIWKLTNSSPIGISLINYFLFVLSISLLITYLLETSLPKKLFTFAVLITMPSTVIYYIPYTEALFLFTMTIASIGVIQKKYWLYFVGCFLLAMVRPATIFVFLAIILAEVIVFINTKNLSLFIKDISNKSLPFISGYFIAIFIQFLYSGSWMTFLDAQKKWEGGIQLIKGISDWSVEGFGLTTAAIFFVCVPAILFLLFFAIKKNKMSNGGKILELNNSGTEYLLLISIFYLIGIFVFTIITSGGNLHSFFRFTLTSPPFYIALIFLLNYLNEKSAQYFIYIFIALMAITILFLNLVDYGGGRIQFSFFGLYMFIATGLFLILKNRLSQPLQLTIASMLIFLNIVWNTYLLNVFFSNAWIFT